MQKSIREIAEIVDGKLIGDPDTLITGLNSVSEAAKTPCGAIASICPAAMRNRSSSSAVAAGPPSDPSAAEATASRWASLGLPIAASSQKLSAPQSSLPSDGMEPLSQARLSDPAVTQTLTAQPCVPCRAPVCRPCRLLFRVLGSVCTTHSSLNRIARRTPK